MTAAPLLPEVQIEEQVQGLGGRPGVAPRGPCRIGLPGKVIVNRYEQA